MRSSLRNRIKITKTGKVLRRHMGVDHFRSKKSSNQKSTLRKSMGLNYKLK